MDNNEQKLMAQFELEHHASPTTFTLDYRKVHEGSYSGYYDFGTKRMYEGWKLGRLNAKGIHGPKGFLMTTPDGKEHYISADRTVADADRAYGWTPVYETPNAVKEFKERLLKDLKAVKRKLDRQPSYLGYHNDLAQLIEGIERGDFDNSECKAGR